MNTETLITETINSITKRYFVRELDALGWRGDYDRDPKTYLMDYIANTPMEDKNEAERMVRDDMITILRYYGFEYENGEIVDTVAGG